MRNRTYSKILMAPLFMLLAVACSPNQFNQSTEYDDVYFTASDRTTAAPTQTSAPRATRTAPLQSQEQTAVLENYSANQVEEQIVTKYNNGTSNDVVTYYKPGPLVTRASELNYDDFVTDYNNQQLAYYELPLDWNTDWDRRSFNRLVRDDFQFRLAWYDQYYRNQSFRMSQYLSGNFGAAGRRGMFGGPQVGLTVGFGNVFLGYNNMAFVDLNPWGWGWNDPFFRPIGFRNSWAWNRGFGWNRWNRWDSWGWGWNDPFWCPPVGVPWNGGFGWRGGWNNNVFVNNNIFIDRRADRVFATNGARSGRTVVRGPRVSTSRVSTVRNEVINGTAPTTRSSRYADNLNGQRSTAVVNSRSGRANSGRTSRSNSVVAGSGRSSVSSGRANQTRTSAYRFEDSGRSSRSSYVRNNGSTSRSSTSRATRSTTPRDGSRSVSTSRSSRSQGSPSFSRGSSSRSYSTSRTSRSSDSNARSSRSSSSRSAYSRGSSSSRSSYSRGSSSSSRSRGSSYSRGSSSRSSGSSRSMSRGSSRSSSSRSSGSMSRGSSSRSSGSRSSSSRSSSRSSGVSRSGRGS